MTQIERLLEATSAPLASDIDRIADLAAGPLGREHELLLARKNGFYAFASALHVFPADVGSGDSVGLAEWNSEKLWRHEYGDAAVGMYFFAEDVFGTQFAFFKGEVITFDPETGDTDNMSTTLEGWAAKILDDYEYYTGSTVGMRWQRKYRPLQVGERLIPTIPFVLGGEFNEDNLQAFNAVEGMKLRADLAKQIRDLPDGSRIEYRIVN